MRKGCEMSTVQPKNQETNAVKIGVNRGGEGLLPKEVQGVKDSGVSARMMN